MGRCAWTPSPAGSHPGSRSATACCWPRSAAPSTPGCIPTSPYCPARLSRRRTSAGRPTPPHQTGDPAVVTSTEDTMKLWHQIVELETRNLVDEVRDGRLRIAGRAGGPAWDTDRQTALFADLERGWPA